MMPFRKANRSGFSDMKYFKVKTNRASIKKLLAEFQSSIEIGEYLISPRPLPRELPKFYYALVCVKPEGKNIGIVQKFKNCHEISRQDYENEKSSFKYFWSAEVKSA
jgi:hypothetical protein